MVRWISIGPLTKKKKSPFFLFRLEEKRQIGGERGDNVRGDRLPYLPSLVAAAYDYHIDIQISKIKCIILYIDD